MPASAGFFLPEICPPPTKVSGQGTQTPQLQAQ